MVEKPNEDSEPHVQFILRWVFIRKGVGASAQTGVRLTVSACWITHYLMHFFKPAAGIIILIFVLLVLFMFIQSSVEESERKSRVQEQSQATYNKASSYDRCVEAAEFEKESSQSVGRSEVMFELNNGNFQRKVSECVANSPLSSLESRTVEDAKNQMVLNNCEKQVSQSILARVNATPEEIDAQYDQDMRSCEMKYGQ